MKPMTVEIYDIKLLNYSHPFVTFEISVSEGTYIRTLGQIVANSLGCDGALSALERLCEGHFRYENEEPLDPLEYISLPENRCSKTAEDILNGKKISHDELDITSEGDYILNFEQFFSIIRVQKEKISYVLNSIENYKR
jgi:tRNA pseudouridine55 synthase